MNRILSGAMILAQLSGPVGAAAYQDLHAQGNGRRCDPLEIRIVVKARTGKVQDLNSSELEVALDSGPARILSLTPFSLAKGSSGITHILLVQPPFSEFGAPVEIEGIVNGLAHADAFRFTAAVLGPDGVLSSFSPDLHDLDMHLRLSAAAKESMRHLRDWRLAEEKGFLKLRALPGRHVIVRLFNTANPNHIPEKDKFLADSSLDQLAAYDLAPVYHLMPGFDVSSIIPRGDASTEAPVLGSIPDVLGIEQTQQMQRASSRQSELWAERSLRNSMNAGEDESSTEQIVQDIIRDNASTYDLIVQPMFSCLGSPIRRLSLRTNQKEVSLFFPRAVQMIPYSPH